MLNEHPKPLSLFFNRNYAKLQKWVFVFIVLVIIQIATAWLASDFYLLVRGLLSFLFKMPPPILPQDLPSLFPTSFKAFSVMMLYSCRWLGHPLFYAIFWGIVLPVNLFLWMKYKYFTLAK